MEEQSENELKAKETQGRVERYSERVQLEAGDCLHSGFVSTLPEIFRVEFNRFDLSELKDIWDQFGKMNLHGEFEGRYGDLAHLLYLPVDEELIIAATHFWDPSHKCFVFNEVDMVPTIEEYSAILGLTFEASDKVYKKDRKVGFKKKLCRLLDLDNQNMGSFERIKGDSRCVPWSSLRDFIIAHPREERAMSAFALAIYGLVVFPKVSGNVEASIIDFFVRVKNGLSPGPVMVAETLRTLNYCRRNGGRFICCTQMLSMWLRSHFKSKKQVVTNRYIKNHPIKEFLESEWPAPEKKEAWIVQFSSLKSDEVTWLAPWMRSRSLLYKCGEKPWVPLLGLWGVTSYAPLMVRRQLGSKQFIPMTHGLNQMEINYGDPEAWDQVLDAAKMWEKTFTVSQGPFCIALSAGYRDWQAQRAKDIVVRHYELPPPPVIPPLPPVSLEVELERRQFDVERSELQGQVAELEKEIQKWRDLHEKKSEKADKFLCQYNHSQALVKKQEKDITELRERMEFFKKDSEKHRICLSQTSSRSTRYRGESSRPRSDGESRRPKRSVEQPQGQNSQKQQRAESFPLEEKLKMEKEIKELRDAIERQKCEHDSMVKDTQDKISKLEAEKGWFVSVSEGWQDEFVQCHNKLWKVEQHFMGTRDMALEMADKAESLQKGIEPAFGFMACIHRFLGKAKEHYLHVAHLKGTLF